MTRLRSQVQGGNGPKVPWKDGRQGLNRAITARRVPKAAYPDSLRPRSVLSIGGKWERIFRKPMI
jgi:hypothetical protein